MTFSRYLLTSADKEKKEVSKMFERNQILSDTVAQVFEKAFDHLLGLLPEFEASLCLVKDVESTLQNFYCTQVSFAGLSAPTPLETVISQTLERKKLSLLNVGTLYQCLIVEHVDPTTPEDKEKLKEAFAALCEDPKVRAEALSSKELQQAKERISELTSKLTHEVSEKETIVENYETQIRELSNQLLALLESKHN